jgi:rare lipoprotein A
MRRRAIALALIPVTAIGASTSIALAADGAATGAEGGAQISASDHLVRFGQKVTLAGSVPGRPATAVGLQFRRLGAESWRTLQQLQTDVAGNYSTAVRAMRTGTFQAVPSDGVASGSETVKVKALSAFHLSNHNPLAGRSIELHGRVRPGGRRTVRITTGSGSVETKTDKKGLWKLNWSPPHAGTYRLRAVADGNRRAIGARSHPRKITAFRPALASWYGPGLFGNGVACGGTLTPSTMGVANKTLPCGTMVTLRYHGRSVTVPVIDRGPYAGGREFDLTWAVKNALHFPGVGTVLSSR